ncbi:hypothetical protein HBI56_221660 [Parastagonospora nodorum]|nr:hypothetical protein HBI09_215440 [Parastagonospora nodorum]KAH4216939.1 hypothetical protein HBI06_222570 [Parastagonospora nodorum]KAH4226169.1 hypothetical protein HBI05_224240 [Parastagonospora nodorum]KAH4335506.1 hypothetical protein HBH98_234610 [Parastagonospora nodorum]KAH4358208.1 hypothetical protein HBH97_219200 [Parastagonospora nodorum]
MRITALVRPCGDSFDQTLAIGTAKLSCARVHASSGHAMSCLASPVISLEVDTIARTLAATEYQAIGYSTCADSRCGGGAATAVSKPTPKPTIAATVPVQDLSAWPFTDTCRRKMVALSTRPM